VDRYALRIGIAFLLYLGTCWGGPLPNIAGGTCPSNLQSYSTIEDAVSNAAAGGTILVCAGAYPEQVLITKPLTMKGVLSRKAAASITTSPKGGLKQNTIDHLGNI
jgi:pectin methylesterase-like acyl-CoA thioesterase